MKVSCISDTNRASYSSVSMPIQTMPTIVGCGFLAGSGFIGYRCDCGFVATGRTAHAVDFAMNDHNRYRHLEDSLHLDGDEDRIET